jgi:hypothetical protein
MAQGSRPDIGQTFFTPIRCCSVIVDGFSVLGGGRSGPLDGVKCLDVKEQGILDYKKASLWRQGAWTEGVYTRRVAKFVFRLFVLQWVRPLEGYQLAFFRAY